MTRNVPCFWCGGGEAVGVCDEGKPACAVCLAPVPEPEGERHDTIVESFRSDARKRAGAPSRAAAMLVDLLSKNPGLTAGEIAKLLEVPDGARRGSRSSPRGQLDVEGRRHYDRISAALIRAAKVGSLRFEDSPPPRRYFVGDPSKLRKFSDTPSARQQRRWRMRRLDAGLCTRCGECKAERGQLCNECWQEKREQCGRAVA